jgi:hypothetical protein
MYTLIFNTSEMEPTPNSDTSNTILVDTTSNISTNSKILIDSIVVIKKDKSQTVLKSSISEEKLIDKSVDNPLTKQSQILKINTLTDTVVRCKEGTIIKIAKASFINSKTKKPITGIVDLNVTEYYKVSDMLLANLSTVSNGQQLETGGMLFIEAKQGAIDLDLKNDKPIEITFWSKNKKPEMQLFLGEKKNKTINWNLQSESTDRAIEVIEDNIDVPFNVVDQVPTFPGCEDAKDNKARKKCTSNAISKFINKNFNTNVGLELGLNGKQRIYSAFKIDRAGNVIFIQSRANHPKLSEEADRVIGLLPKMIPGMQRGKPVNVPYSLPIVFDIIGNKSVSSKQINRDTSLTSTTIAFAQKTVISPTEMDTIYTNKRGIVEQIREVMHDKDLAVDSLFINQWQQFKAQKLIRNISLETKPNYIETAFILRKPLFEMNDTKFKILEDDSITRGGHIIRVPWDSSKVPTTMREMKLVPKQLFSAGVEAITAKQLETRINNVDDLSVSSKDVGNYVFKTYSLGWINCDRFINSLTKRITYSLEVKNADDASINMVFKSVNSILPSWKTNNLYNFRTVADQEDVILVAIKRKNGKLFYDMVETKTKVNPEIDFDFKEVNIEQLKKELKTLNSNFN